MLDYVPVCEQNLSEAVALQAKIFRERCPSEIHDAVYPQKYGLYNYAQYWLVKHEGKTIGITGLYGYEKYPDDVFMNWYGVCVEARKQGFGTQILHWTIEQARQMGFKCFRLYTEVGDNDAAISLYRKNGMTEEKYTAEKGVHNMVIFSKSLTAEKATLWNNRYIAIWESYMLYGSNLPGLLKANPQAGFWSIVRHPRILFFLLRKKLHNIRLGKNGWRGGLRAEKLPEV